LTEFAVTLSGYSLDRKLKPRFITVIAVTLNRKSKL
jgi:hypothetical protein